MVRVALAGYATKTNRKRLKNAIYGGSKLLYAQVLKEDRDLALVSSDYRLMNFNTSLLKTKTTTNTQGVQAFTAKKGRSVTTVGTTEEILGAGVSAEKFTAQSLPSAGALMKENDMPSLFDERPQLRVILVWHYRKRGLSGTHNVTQPPFTSPCAFSWPAHGQKSDLFLRKQTGRYRHLDD